MSNIKFQNLTFVKAKVHRDMKFLSILKTLDSIRPLLMSNHCMLHNKYVFGEELAKLSHNCWKYKLTQSIKLCNLAVFKTQPKFVSLEI